MVSQLELKRRRNRLGVMRSIAAAGETGFTSTKMGVHNLLVGMAEEGLLRRMKHRWWLTEEGCLRMMEYQLNV